MTNKSDPETQVNADAALNVAAAPKQAGDAGQVDQWLTDLNGLLRELEVITAANYALPPVLGKPADNQLIQVRLESPAACSPPCNANMPPRPGTPCAWP